MLEDGTFGSANKGREQSFEVKSLSSARTSFATWLEKESRVWLLSILMSWSDFH